MAGVQAADPGVLEAVEEVDPQVVTGVVCLPHPPTHSNLSDSLYRSRWSRPLRSIQLRSLVRLVYTQRLALRSMDCMVGTIRMSANRLAWLDGWAVEE
jgi:hypothetical protein